MALIVRLLFHVHTGFPGADNRTAAGEVACNGVEGAALARCASTPQVELCCVAAVVGLVRLGRRLVAAVDSPPFAHWTGS